eukprot:2894438-Rhodomonas_salina.1
MHASYVVPPGFGGGGVCYCGCSAYSCCSCSVLLQSLALGFDVGLLAIDDDVVVCMGTVDCIVE